jgi:hypothetical protein
MSRAWRTRALVLTAAAVFSWGVISLFNRQFASGELYPPFSSMRTDQLGTKLLFDSLGKLPAIAVERNFLPMELARKDGATWILLALPPLEVSRNGALFLKPMERIASRGNRVVLAMRVDADSKRPMQEDLDQMEPPPARGSKQKSKPEPPIESPIRTLWKVRLTIDPDVKNPHPLWFGQADGWRTIDQVGPKVLAIERDFGKGSVVLMAESSEFANESTVAMDRLRQVAGVIGPYRRIVFDEQHLGIAESGSVVAMARQFHLTGLAIGLALCAALFIWKNSSSFPPLGPVLSGERFSGRTSQAGLLTLLKRHIPAAELAAVCWREWLSTNRREATPERQKQAEAILAGASARPVEATREIQALVHAKGEL